METATPEPAQETAIMPVTDWGRSKEAALHRGKFNERRRAIYLHERAAGTPHLTAVRRADISPSTYDRYSAAAGDPWKAAVRYAVEEGLDPIRAVRRAAAMEGEPWAVRAEIGTGRDVPARSASGGEGGTVNIGAVVIGGEQGIGEALGGLLDRLRERERTSGELE